MRNTPYRLALLAAIVVASGCPLACAAADKGVEPPPASQPDAPKDKDAPQDTVQYIEYRALPELGQIQISSGAVRGVSAVKRLIDDPGEFAKRGVFACVDKSKRHTYRRREKMDGHEIDTRIVVDPPPAKTKDDAEDYEPSFISRVVVTIDGHKKVNCSIGDSPTGDVTVFGVSVFPEDGTVDASAADSDGYELTLPEASLKFDSPDVITDDSFFEDDPNNDGEPEKMKPAPVKVIAPAPVQPLTEARRA
jgi:hypothetical protein